MLRSALVLALAAAAWADGPVRQPHTDAELVCAVTSLPPGGEVRLGLRFKLDEFWHVYWRNPGDAGMCPSLEWSLPPGFVAGPIEWPAPHRIPTGPLMTYGYSGELVLPVRLTVPAGLGGKDVTLKAKADWLVCNDVCMDGAAALELTLPVGEGERDARWATLFERAERERPEPLPAEASRAGDWFQLRVQGIEADTLEFFPDGDVIQHAAEQVFSREEGGVLVLTLAAADPEWVADRLRGIVVSTTAAGRRAYAVDAAVGSGTSSDVDAYITTGGTLLWVGAVVIGLLVALLLSLRNRRRS